MLSEDMITIEGTYQELEGKIAAAKADVREKGFLQKSEMGVIEETPEEESEIFMLRESSSATSAAAV